MPTSYDDARERAYTKNKRDLTTGDIDDAHRATRTQQKDITTSRVKGRTYTAKGRKPSKIKGYGLRNFFCQDCSRLNESINAQWKCEMRKIEIATNI